jgi:hypothetical protein
VLVTTSTTAGRGSAAAPTAQAGAKVDIKLVDFTGSQPPGFTISRVPAAWHVSTSVSSALCLVPDDGSVTNDDPNWFVDKLCVLPQSVDVHGLGPGDAVTVNGRDGRVRNDDPTFGPVLSYTTADGQGVVVESPPALHWTDQDIVAFAVGVTVTANVATVHG